MATPLDQVQAGPQDVTSPAPVDTSSLPTSTPQNQIVAPPPDVAGGVQPQDMPAVNSSSTMPAQAPPAGWRSVLIGALQGLAMGQGIARGAITTAAIGETPAQRLRDANDQRQQDAALNQENVQSTIRFRDASTAETVLKNKQYQAELDALPAQQQQAYYDANQKTVNFLKDLGFSFDTTLDHTSGTSATAALHTVNDIHGEVPHVAAFPVSPNLSLVISGNAASPQKLLEGLDALRTINTGLAMSDSEQKAFMALDQKTQQSLFAAEANRSKPLPGDPRQMTVYKDQLQNALNNIKQNRPGAKDEIAALQSRLDAVNQALPHAQAEMDRQQAIKAAYQQRAADAAEQRKQQLQASSVANTNFVDKNYIQPATTVEQSYQLFQDAYAHRNDPTGAASMAGLSTHLSTTFGSVKGSRITKDMIQEHLGARGVSDSALVAVQKLTTGSVLSPQQWDAFKQLISSSRQTKWSIAAQQAMARHMSDADIAARMPADLVHTATNPKTGQKIISFAGGPWHISGGQQ